MNRTQIALVMHRTAVGLCDVMFEKFAEMGVEKTSGFGGTEFKRCELGVNQVGSSTEIVLHCGIAAARDQSYAKNYNAAIKKDIKKKDIALEQYVSKDDKTIAVRTYLKTPNAGVIMKAEKERVRKFNDRIYEIRSLAQQALQDMEFTLHFKDESEALAAIDAAVEKFRKTIS